MSRMKVFTYGIATVGVLAGTIAPASAADLLAAPPPPVEAVGTPVTELGSGWYLRGDVGYIAYSKPREEVGYSQGLPFDAIKLERTISYGGGFGYKFNEWLRADVTVDHREDARIRALSSGTGYVQGYSTDALKLESTTALVNGYIDLGSWWGLTPYVGGGIGVAHNNLHEYSSQVTCITDLCRTNYSQDRVPMPGGKKTNFAWALMAGTAIDLGMGFKLDVGYRYIQLGENQTKLDSGGYGFKSKPLDAHEARVGIRYMID